MELDKLKEAFDTFTKIPFPANSNDAIASELRAELVLHDMLVAGIISNKLCGDDDYSKMKLLDLGDLKNRLQKLTEEGLPEAVRDAKIYLQYLQKLENLIQLAFGQNPSVEG